MSFCSIRPAGRCPLPGEVLSFAEKKVPKETAPPCCCLSLIVNLLQLSEIDLLHGEEGLGHAVGPEYQATSRGQFFV